MQNVVVLILLAALVIPNSLFVKGQTFGTDVVLTAPITITRGVSIPYGNFAQRSSFSDNSMDNRINWGLNWKLFLCEGTLTTEIKFNDLASFCKIQEIGASTSCSYNGPPSNTSIQFVSTYNAFTQVNTGGSAAAVFDIIFERKIPANNASDIIPVLSDNNLDVLVNPSDSKADHSDVEVTWTGTGDSRDTYTVYKFEGPETGQYNSQTACGIELGYVASDETIENPSANTYTVTLQTSNKACQKITVIASRAGGYMAKYQTKNIGDDTVCRGSFVQPVAWLFFFTISLLLVQ